MIWFVVVCFQIAVHRVMCCGNVLISEVNADTPETQELSEFIELWNTGNCKANLDGCEVALYSGHANSPERYVNFDLSNLCIPGNGYFLIGGSALPNSPEVLSNLPGFIQNGNGQADAVALYKSFTDTSAFKVGNSLVDVIIYDKLANSDTSAYFPAYLSPQPHVIEDEAYLSGDEGMSRCHQGSTNMSAFSVRRLTPKAPNTCQTDVLTRWPSPCSDTQFASPPTVRSIHYKTEYNVKGTSSVVGTPEVESVIQCSVKCTQENMCTHFSYFEDGDGTSTCNLHSRCITDVMALDNGIVGVKYYTISANNPVWPHEAVQSK